jgi:hypothetical protein
MNVAGFMASSGRIVRLARRGELHADGIVKARTIFLTGPQQLATNPQQEKAAMRPPSNMQNPVFDYMPGLPRTVTARRFCDQQEMSSQDATGRSLPYEIVLMRLAGTPLEAR